MPGWVWVVIAVGVLSMFVAIGISVAYPDTKWW